MNKFEFYNKYFDYLLVFLFVGAVAVMIYLTYQILKPKNNGRT